MAEAPIGPRPQALGHNRGTLREFLGRLAQRCFEPLSDIDVNRVAWNTIVLRKKSIQR